MVTAKVGKRHALAGLEALKELFVSRWVKLIFPFLLIILIMLSCLIVWLRRIPSIQFAAWSQIEDTLSAAGWSYSGYKRWLLTSTLLVLGGMFEAKVHLSRNFQQVFHGYFYLSSKYWSICEAFFQNLIQFGGVAQIDPWPYMVDGHWVFCPPS